MYSGGVVVGVQTTKYSIDVMREYGRQGSGEPCNSSQVAISRLLQTCMQGGGGASKLVVGIGVALARSNS